MKIRMARITDAENIANVYFRSFYRTFRTDENEIPLTAYLHSFNEDAIIQSMNRSDTQFYLAENGSTLLGFIQLCAEKPYEGVKEDHLKIERLYIDIDIQSSGVGSALMKEAINFASNNRYAWIWLLVLRSNSAGVRFYEKFEFETFDTAPGKFEEDAELDLLMRRSLG